MENFIFATLGGLIIGGAAIAMLYFLGRITGISGIFWGAISWQADKLWRWLFLAGLLAGPLIVHFLLQMPTPPPSESGWLWAIAAGFLVGFGTRLGNGCTSGHGVCGIGRRSLRSTGATLTFMIAGIATVFVVRHLLN